MYDAGDSKIINWEHGDWLYKSTDTDIEMSMKNQSAAIMQNAGDSTFWMFHGR
jgi:hypothetical protein